MARDHRKLRVSHDAHALALLVYQETKAFPRDEWFGLRAQVRRAAVSVPNNIVEGCARWSTREYFRFLNVARGSASETRYLTQLAFELSFLSKSQATTLLAQCDRVTPQLESLLKEIDLLAKAETRPKAKSPKPRVVQT